MRTLARVLKWLFLAVLAAVIVLAVHVGRTWNRTYNAEIPDIHASTDPAVVARGEYLVFGPAHCVECHSSGSEEVERYYQTGQRPSLAGGMAFVAAPLGTIYSRNLTPDPETGIGNHSDGEIARMLRYSVKLDGRASVRPLMQYEHMSDDDMAAVISFLRTLPPVKHQVQDTEWSLIGKVVKSLAPTFKPRENVVALKVAPPSGPTRERGAYLAAGVADCSGCHSPLDQLTFSLNGPEYSGGAPMEPRDLPGVDKTLWFAPPNITPFPGSALNRFPDRDTFIARFKNGGRKHPASPMPWDCFGKMTTDDIGALYEYFRSIPPAGAAAPEDPE